MGQHRADLGQHTANIGEHRAEIGPREANIGPTWPHFGWRRAVRRKPLPEAFGGNRRLYKGCQPPGCRQPPPALGVTSGSPPPILGFPVTAMGVRISKVYIGEHRVNIGAT